MFLAGLEEQGEPYIVQVSKTFGVRKPGEVVAASLRTLPAGAGGRPRTRPHPVRVAPLYTAAEGIAAVPPRRWQRGRVLDEQGRAPQRLARRGRGPPAPRGPPRPPGRAGAARPPPGGA